MEKKQIIAILVGAAVLAVALVIISKFRGDDSVALVETYVTPEIGHFEMIVTATGEIEAEYSVNIEGPQTTNNRIRVEDIDILDLVEEGTQVSKGDYIATLDKTSLENTYKDAQETLETRWQSYELALLDSAVTLSNQRSNLQNSLYSIEAAQIKLDQVSFESPATVRSAERALEKAKQSYEASVKQYQFTVQKQIQNINNVKDRYNDQKQLVADYAKMLDQFVVYSPASGVVNYYKNRNGEKLDVGSSINSRENIVAVLPDMSSLISKTYVNEIDVNTIDVGDDVLLTLDALPGKRYTGKVISVANVGEQLAKADAKVFEVIVRFDNVDANLRTGMTTGNRINTGSYEDVMFIPLACVHKDENNIPFVYMKNGSKQIVLLGASNDNHIIVEDGLKENATIYLQNPEKPEKFHRISGEEFIPIIQQRRGQSNSLASN
jgi:multidrug efflux pump subunit AcrA (membrane-fusion protein)